MDTWQLIDAQAKVLDPFYQQVTATRKRLNMTPFVMTDPLTKEPMDDVINVTENRSVTLMLRIIAGLMAGKWQTVVEGQVSKRESHKIELFLESNFQQTDEFLYNEYGMASLDAWLWNHVCHTSLIGVRWMCRLEDGEYKIYACPLDMRWTPFVLGKWTAPITWQTKEELLKELEGFEKEGRDDAFSEYFQLKDKEDGDARLKDTDNEVRDYMDGEKRELWVEKQLVFTQPNIYGKPPDIIVWPPTGFMFRDKGYLAHESPGLLYPNEGLLDQLSRQLSTDATLAFNVINPRWEKERATLVADQPSEPLPKRGQTSDVLVGERHLPVPDPDINRAELASRDQVNSLIEQGGPSAPRNYTSPPSAIEVTTEVELIDQFQNPRIIAVQMFKSSLARLMIEQFIQVAKGSVDVGRVGKKANFNAETLKDPKRYLVNFQMRKQNKRLDIVNYAQGLALWGKAPSRYIIERVWQVEDPDGFERQMEMEKAKVVNPAIGYKEWAIRYAEEAEDMEDGPDKDSRNHDSMLMVHEYVMLMRARMMPAPPSEAQNVRESSKETGNSNALIPMLGPGKGLL